MNGDYIDQLHSMVRDNPHRIEDPCIELLYSFQDRSFLDSQEEAAWEESSIYS
jgi:hypothetical protein